MKFDHAMLKRLQPRQFPKEAEFVALIATIMALNALSIDIILPALGIIAVDFALADPNSAQLIIILYVLSFGAGQLVAGPFADRFGRRNLLLAALTLYVIGNLIASFSGAFSFLIAARCLQGITAAFLRICAMAIVRDRFEGRAMARIMSLAMMVFMAAPLLAPALGQVLIILSNWHMLFIVVAAIGIAALIWAMLRMPESLITERRRPLSLRALLEGYGMIFQQRRAWGYMVASGFTFGCLFAFISASNQILLIRYHVGALFPLAFAAVACGMIVSNFTNARLVERLGMRALSHTALALFCVVNLVHAGFAAIGFQPFWLFVVLVSTMIGLLGFLGANFTALSLEPVGQIAGLASSLQGFISTGVAGVLGGLVGLQFDGTARPFAYGIAALSLAALACVAVTERGQMRWFHWRGEGETEPSINVVKPQTKP